MIFEIQVRNSIERLSLEILTTPLDFSYFFFCCLFMLLVCFDFSTFRYKHTHHLAHDWLFYAITYFLRVIWKYRALTRFYCVCFSLALFTLFVLSLTHTLTIALLTSTYLSIYRNRPNNCINCLWPVYFIDVSARRFYCIAKHNYDNSLEKVLFSAVCFGVFIWFKDLGLGCYLFSFVQCRADKIHFAKFF